MRTHAWLSLLLTVACGPSGGNQVGPDAVLPPPTDPCTSPADCDASAPICTASGVCVQCETSDHCPADKPVCAEHTCTAACAGSEVTADFVQLPSDIIWVVDQSGSMDQETQYVQAKINDFVNLISATNIDYRVVMMASTTGSNSICVPGPLASTSPACGNNTRFRLVNVRVRSTDGPALISNSTNYALYSDFLRADATKHFVFVTDDNSAMSATAFMDALAAKTPAGIFSGAKVHAIYAYGNGTATGCAGPFGTGAKDGTVYTTLVANTGGARGVICENDWTQVFTDITTAIVSGTQVSCELTIPPPPMGESLDPAKVNVKYTSGGNSTTFKQAASAAQCAMGGWYYDDNTAPTKITLCPSTCASVQQDPGAAVKIEFGCAAQLL